jgi:hypothetical protein
MPVTAAVRTVDGRGYWILLSNGTVDAYGDANAFGGPVGDMGGVDSATAIFTTADGGGYWVVSADGGVYAFGDATGDGSLSGQHLNGPIVAGSGW